MTVPPSAIKFFRGGNRGSRKTRCQGAGRCYPRGADRRIHLAMQPDRPILAGSLRILHLLNNPAEEKFDGCSSHRRVLTPKPERGLVSIVGHNGLFYANAVGAPGLVSAGQNWGRLASAAHRLALKLVDGKEFPYYYFRTTPWF